MTEPPDASVVDAQQPTAPATVPLVPLVPFVPLAAPPVWPPLSARLVSRPSPRLAPLFIPLLALLAACSGGAGGDASSVTSAADTVSLRSAPQAAAASAVARKAIHPYYRATPITAPEGEIAPASTILADGGQLTGQVRINGGYTTRYFSWSPSSGFLTLPVGVNRVADINASGQIAGSRTGSSPAFNSPYRWSPMTGLEPPLRHGGNGAAATGIDDDGLVVGNESGYGFMESYPVYWLADGTRYRITVPGADNGRISTAIRGGIAAGTSGSRLLVWSLSSGAQVIERPAGTLALGGLTTGHGGHVAGYVVADDEARTERPFIWTAGGGFRVLGVDLPRETHRDEAAYGVSRAGAVIASIAIQSRPFYATEAAGAQDILGDAGVTGRAQAISADGTVVGWYASADERQRAFIWREGEGLVDLNARIDPALGIHLDGAIRVTDSGHVVAVSEGRLLMLGPETGSTSTAPVLAPIEAEVTVSAATAFTAMAGFRDADVGEVHQAVWNWGDGSAAEPAEVWFADGSGTVRGSHAYAEPGLYEISLTLTDAAGNQAKATRQIAVHGVGDGLAGGVGHFLSPAGAYPGRPELAARAEFAFAARLRQPDSKANEPSSAAPRGVTVLRLREADLRFRSTAHDWMVVSGPRVQYAGSGVINGEGDYRFVLTAIDSGDSPARDRIRLRITDLKGIVIYDNQVPGPTAPEGTALSGGRIKVGE